MTKRIAIHSVPRSGSSWLGQIFNSSPEVNFKFQPLFSYAFKDALNLDSSKKDIECFFEQIAKSKDDFINNIEDIKKGKYPQFKKSDNFSSVVYKEVRYHHLLHHLMATDSELRVVGLIRNPKAVINSWLRAPKEFKKELNWKVEEEWLDAPQKNGNKPEEFNGFNKWLECREIFKSLKDKYPNRFIEVQYDELLADSEGMVKKIFNFCEIKYEEQTATFLTKSRTKENQDAYSVFKTKVEDNSWEAELDQSIINKIDERLKQGFLSQYLT